MAEIGNAEVLDLRRYLSALRRRKAIIVVALVAMVGTAIGLSSLQTPLYRGEARVLVQPGGSGRVFDAESSATELDPELVLETEMQALASEAVRSAVSAKLGPVGEVDAERVGQSLLVAVRGTSTSPELAAAIADEYASTYVGLRRDQAVAELVAAGDQLQAKLADLRVEIDVIESQIAAIPASDTGTLSAQLERRDALVGQEARFSEKLDEIEVEASLASGGARVVATSSLPTKPIQPKPVRNLALASIVGLLLGIGVVCLLEYFDSSVRTKEDLARALDGIPVLGVIPAVPRWRRQHDIRLTTATERDAQAMEAYRSLRTSLQLLGVERPLTTLQVTSPNAGDGKTTTLINLAMLFASMGQRVVVLDCDLRRPRLHDAFSLPNDVGVTTVLADLASLPSAMHDVKGDTSDEPLVLITSGPPPSNPSELLGSKVTAELIYRLQSEFDLVLIDSPPVLPVTDATVMSSWVEATLLVVSAEATSRSQLRDAAELLLQAEATIVGAVLNWAAAKPGYGYGYSTYGSDGGDHAGVRRLFEERRRGLRQLARARHDRGSRQLRR